MSEQYKFLVNSLSDIFGYPLETVDITEQCTVASAMFTAQANRVRARIYLVAVPFVGNQIIVTCVIILDTSSNNPKLIENACRLGDQIKDRHFVEFDAHRYSFTCLTEEFED